MKWAWLVVLWLLLPAVAYSQIEVVSFDPPQKPGVVVGGNYSPADVAKAKEVLAATEPKELKLKLGEFEVIEPSKTAKEPLQFQYLTNKCYFLFRVKPGMAFGFAGVRRGDTEERQHEFEPKPYEWAIVKARAQGSETLVVNRNGKDATKDPPEEIDRISVVVGEKKPDDPKPPNPDDPKPPMPGQGFRVLIVLESRDLSTLPSSQVAALTAREVREYLNAKCIKEGNQPAWRMWDKDTDISREDEHWKEAMKRKRDSLPWLLVSDGQKGYEGPMPKTTAELLAKLKEIGGN